MSSKSSEQLKKDLSHFQEKKLHIDNIETGEDTTYFESELELFLSKYGTVVDLIIMENSKLNRERK